MTRLEHLLTIVAEECAEVAERASKANRFGLDEIQDDEAQGTHDNPLGWTNRERLHREFCDLVAVLYLIDPHIALVTQAHIDAKVTKVYQYLAYARHCGTLQE